jgi:hypothetical protein
MTLINDYITNLSTFVKIDGQMSKIDSTALQLAVILLTWPFQLLCVSRSH